MESRALRPRLTLRACVKLIGFNDYRKIKALRSGSATTDAGGTVTITRIVAFKDGSKETEKWTHKYKPEAAG